MRVVIANLKGGVTKTTSSIYIATALSERGRTLLVDADPQGSALSWGAAVEETGRDVPFALVGLAVKDLNRRLAPLARDYEHVVIDTPPGDLPIVASALKAANVAVIPVQPTSMDMRQISPTLDLLEDVAAVNEDLSYTVLLSRVKRISRAGRDAREVLEENELPVLVAEIPELGAYTASDGAFNDLGGYAAVTAELLDIAGESPSEPSENGRS